MSDLFLNSIMRGKYPMPAKTAAVDDARPQDESSVAFLHVENRSMRFKIAELEAQLRQEREAHAETKRELDDAIRFRNTDEQAQVARLQTTIIQLQAQIPDRGETLGTIIYDPAKGTVEYERVNITQKPEEEAKP